MTITANPRKMSEVKCGKYCLGCGGDWYVCSPLPATTNHHPTGCSCLPYIINSRQGQVDSYIFVVIASLKRNAIELELELALTAVKKNTLKCCLFHCVL